METESERLERWRKEDAAYLRSDERAADRRRIERVCQAAAERDDTKELAARINAEPTPCGAVEHELTKAGI